VTGYTRPDDVIYPKSHVELLGVIYDEQAEGYSLALIRWDGDECIGFRWNGGVHTRLGSPSSRGYPTWEVLPNMMGRAVVRECQREASLGNTAVRLDGLAMAVAWLNGGSA